jgi:hypothetical protein
MQDTSSSKGSPLPASKSPVIAYPTKTPSPEKKNAFSITHLVLTLCMYLNMFVSLCVFRTKLNKAAAGSRKELATALVEMARDAELSLLDDDTQARHAVAGILMSSKNDDGEIDHDAGELFCLALVG